MQHTADAPAATRKALNARATVIKAGKSALEKLPPSARRRLIALADKSGATGLLMPDAAATPRSASTSAKKLALPTTKNRKSLVNQALRAGIDGDSATLEQAADTLAGLGVVTREEEGTLSAARSFAHFSTRPSEEKVDLVWWVRPFPGQLRRLAQPADHRALHRPEGPLPVADRAVAHLRQAPRLGGLDRPLHQAELGRRRHGHLERRIPAGPVRRVRLGARPSLGGAPGSPAAARPSSPLRRPRGRAVADHPGRARRDQRPDGVHPPPQAPQPAGGPARGLRRARGAGLAPGRHPQVRHAARDVRPGRDQRDARADHLPVLRHPVRPHRAPPRATSTRSPATA